MGRWRWVGEDEDARVHGGIADAVYMGSAVCCCCLPASELRAKGYDDVPRQGSGGPLPRLQRGVPRHRFVKTRGSGRGGPGRDLYRGSDRLSSRPVNSVLARRAYLQASRDAGTPSLGRDPTRLSVPAFVGACEYRLHDNVQSRSTAVSPSPPLCFACLMSRSVSLILISPRREKKQSPNLDMSRPPLVRQGASRSTHKTPAAQSKPQSQ